MTRLCVLLVLFSFPAYAHGPAAWIQNGKYTNIAGELCCGERDCGLYIGGTIEHQPSGYEVDADFRVGEGDTSTVFHLKQFIADRDATPSPTGDYWACQWGGKVRCFFSPPPGS